MTDLKQKRLVGWIDRIDDRRDEKQCGFIVTECWDSYFWHSGDVNGRMPELNSIVSFDPAPPAKEGQRPRAINIRVEKEKASPDYFGKFARFVREKAEEVA